MPSLHRSIWPIGLAPEGRTLSNGFRSGFVVHGRLPSRPRHPPMGPEKIPHGEDRLTGLAGPILGWRPTRCNGQQRPVVLGVFLSNLYQPGQKGLLRNVTGNGHAPPLQLLQPAYQARRKGRPLQLPQLPRVSHLALREVQEVLTTLQVRKLRLRRPVGEHPWVPM